MRSNLFLTMGSITNRGQYSPLQCVFIRAFNKAGRGFSNCEYFYLNRRVQTAYRSWFIKWNHYIKGYFLECCCKFFMPFTIVLLLNFFVIETYFYIRSQKCHNALMCCNKTSASTLLLEEQWLSYIEGWAAFTRHTKDYIVG